MWKFLCESTLKKPSTAARRRSLILESCHAPLVTDLELLPDQRPRSVLAAMDRALYAHFSPFQIFHLYLLAHSFTQEQIAHGFIPIATQCRQCGGEGTIISDPCTTCKGQGVISGNRKLQVKIPAGVDDGSNIRLVGQGDAGIKGGKPGNLFLRVHVCAYAHNYGHTKSTLIYPLT